MTKEYSVFPIRCIRRNDKGEMRTHDKVELGMFCKYYLKNIFCG